MKIKSVQIKNYKSIKNVTFTPSPKMNVFIGENSVGKSNVINAIYWLLGPVFPTFNSTMKKDHYGGKTENEISISLDFDDGCCLALAETWINNYNQEKCGLSLDNNYINNEARNSYCSAYLDIRREIVDYLPSNRWSLLGRFLQDVNAKFMTESITLDSGETELKSKRLVRELTQLRDELLFSVNDAKGKPILPEFLDHIRTECARQLNRNPSEFNLDMNIYDPWNFYKTLQILVTDSDVGLDFQASNMGMGIQASLSIAIIKAYSELKLANNTPIFIDEPELFLHPQAQRNFYNILTKLAESGTQIFLTTHSPSFINLAKFDQIFVVKKSPEKGTYIRAANPKNFVTDLKIRTSLDTNPSELMERYAYAYDNTGDTQKANEAFFAKKIILVEGESESLILPYFFKLLGYDYVADNVSIVRCGGKSEIDRFYRLYSEFGIPCYIIFDGDKQHTKPSEIKEDIRKNKAILSLFGCDYDYPHGYVSNGYLGFSTCLEENLDISDVPNVKGLKLYQFVKEKIKDSESVPEWVTEIIGKIKMMPSEAQSILKKEVVDSTQRFPWDPLN